MGGASERGRGQAGAAVGGWCGQLGAPPETARCAGCCCCCGYAGPPEGGARLVNIAGLAVGGYDSAGAPVGGG